MVINGVATERDGAIVGRKVPNQTAHADILAVLKKIGPLNEFQAEQIARGAARDTLEETQDSLFAPETVTNSLYGERAKVLDGAMWSLKKRKGLSNMLKVREGEVSGMSDKNQLDTAANRSEADNAATAAHYLKRQANRKGPISDALTEAARAVKNGERIGNAVTSFLKSVRNGQDESGKTGSKVGQAGPNTEPEGGNGTDAGLDGQTQKVRTDTEKTDAGDQILMPGVAPITDKDRAEVEANKPMKGGNAPMDGGQDSLFGDPNDRGDLFDAQAPKADAKPEGEPDTRGTYTGATEAEGTNDRGMDSLHEGFEGFDPENVGDEAAKWIVQKGKSWSREHAVTLNDKGEVAAIGRGKTAKSVSFTNPATKGKRGDNLIFYHGHPDGFAFSFSDIAGFMFGSIRVGYANSYNGTNYRVEIPEYMVDWAYKQASRKSFNPVVRAVLSHFNRLDRWIARNLHRAMDRLTNTDPDLHYLWSDRVAYTQIYTHIINTILHEQGVIIYERQNGKHPDNFLMDHPDLQDVLQRFRATVDYIFDMEAIPDADRSPKPRRHIGDMAGFPGATSRVEKRPGTGGKSSNSGSPHRGGKRHDPDNQGRDRDNDQVNPDDSALFDQILDQEAPKDDADDSALFDKILDQEAPKDEAKPKGKYEQGKVGQKLETGQKVLTTTGRTTTAFPRLDFSTERKTQNTLKRVDRWLMQNAVSEAKARGDDFNLIQFEQASAKPSQSDKDSAEYYLFDPDFLTGPTKPAPRPTSKPQTMADVAKGIKDMPKPEKYFMKWHPRHKETCAHLDFSDGAGHGTCL